MAQNPAKEESQNKGNADDNTDTNAKDPIPVPRAVLDGIESVSQSGMVNMLDYPSVICLACETPPPTGLPRT